MTYTPTFRSECEARRVDIAYQISELDKEEARLRERLDEVAQLRRQYLKLDADYAAAIERAASPPTSAAPSDDAARECGELVVAGVDALADLDRPNWPASSRGGALMRPATVGARVPPAGRAPKAFQRAYVDQVLEPRPARVPMGPD